MYSSVPYAFAQGDVELPYLVLQSFLYSAVTYWLIRHSSPSSSTTWFLKCSGAQCCAPRVEVFNLMCRYEYSAAKFFWYTLFMLLSLAYYSFYGELRHPLDLTAC